MASSCGRDVDVSRVAIMLYVRFRGDDAFFFCFNFVSFCFWVKSVSCSMDKFFHERGEKVCTVVIFQ